jgi:signal transduction histidine kinase
LIRSVLKEVKQREQLEILSKQLAEANEQLKLLDKARAEFISIASHQLRTPPATIKWYVAAVLAGDFGNLAPELQAAIERVQVTNDAQIHTIDDLLNASRIERGKLEFFFEQGDLQMVTQSIVDQLTPLAQMKKLALVYHKPNFKLPELLLDKEKIRQVINNFIDNAIKYSMTGNISVDLTQDKENLIVKVTDNGKGIKPEEAPHLFDKYARGHDSVTHATGLGLGLYVAKVIVEQHLGKIWAESAGEGKGASFFFSLPIKSDLKPTTVDLTKTQA